MPRRPRSSSPLIGQSVRELRFRDRFNAAVVAVARSGERIRAKPGDIVLQRGDILLLDTGAAFAQQNKVRRGAVQLTLRELS